MQRRRFLLALAAAPFSALAATRQHETHRELQKSWKSFLPAGASVPSPQEPLKVLREEGTERAGTSPLHGEKRPGIFACAGWQAAAFHLGDKYESGTGWPSFFTTIRACSRPRRILPATSIPRRACAATNGREGMSILPPRAFRRAVARQPGVREGGEPRRAAQRAPRG